MACSVSSSSIQQREHHIQTQMQLLVHKNIVTKCMWLCSSKILLMNPEIWISHNLYVSQNIILLLIFLPQTFKSIKTIFSSWTIQKTPKTEKQIGRRPNLVHRPVCWPLPDDFESDLSSFLPSESQINLINELDVLYFKKGPTKIDSQARILKNENIRPC